MNNEGDMHFISLSKTEIILQAFHTASTIFNGPLVRFSTRFVIHFVFLLLLWVFFAEKTSFLFDTDRWTMTIHSAEMMSDGQLDTGAGQETRPGSCQSECQQLQMTVPSCVAINVWTRPAHLFGTVVIGQNCHFSCGHDQFHSDDLTCASCLLFRFPLRFSVVATGCMYCFLPIRKAVELVKCCHRTASSKMVHITNGAAYILVLLVVSSYPHVQRGCFIASTQKKGQERTTGTQISPGIWRRRWRNVVPQSFTHFPTGQRNQGSSNSFTLPLSLRRFTHTRSLVGVVSVVDLFSWTQNSYCCVALMLQEILLPAADTSQGPAECADQSA